VQVSVDQILWTVDVAGWLVTRALCGRGRWLIGVAQYLAWPSTTWARRASSTHHLWFLPAVAVAVGVPCTRAAGHSGRNGDGDNGNDDGNGNGDGTWPAWVGGFGSSGDASALGSWGRAFAADYALSLVVMAATAAATRSMVPHRMPPGYNDAIPAPAPPSHSDSSRTNSRARSRSRSRSKDASAKGSASGSTRESAAGDSHERGAYLNVNLVYEVRRAPHPTRCVD
jgi:hypothetical protein